MNVTRRQTIALAFTGLGVVLFVSGYHVLGLFIVVPALIALLFV